MSLAHQFKLSFLVILLPILSLFLVSCNSTAVKILNRDTPTSPATSTLAPTKKPTKTPKPTATYTPEPTTTSTPQPGSFINPLRIGDSISLETVPEEVRVPEVDYYDKWDMTLLDVKVGEEANLLAKEHFGWIYYDEPIEGQEYLAVYVRQKILYSFDNNEVETIYAYWNLTLRYEDGGRDIWSVDVLQKLAEGYPPIEGEGWVFFLIRTGSEPKLYFQPRLMISEQLGYRTLGVYYQLFE